VKGTNDRGSEQPSKREASTRVTARGKRENTTQTLTQSLNAVKILTFGHEGKKPGEGFGGAPVGNGEIVTSTKPKKKKTNGNKQPLEVGDNRPYAGNGGGENKIHRKGGTKVLLKNQTREENQGQL